MTNKRQLKKYVKYVCGDLAAEIIIARHIFDGYDNKAVEKLVLDIAQLQETTLANISFAFDKAKHDFASAAEYRKALTTYRHTAYKKLLDEFHNGVEAIVKEMNAITPQTVRDTFKSAEK